MDTYSYKTFKLSGNKTYEKKIEILNKIIKYQELTKQMGKTKNGDGNKAKPTFQMTVFKCV